MFEERRAQLSEAGQARRAAMLGELIVAMDAHHARRRVRRRAAACGAAALLVIGAAYFIAGASSPPPVAPTKIAQIEQASEVESATPGPRIVRVETDPGIVDRYRATSTNMVTIIDDTELLETLHAMHRPAGLVRMGERVFVTASVADQPAHAPGRPNSL